MTVEERARQITDELFWGIGANPSKETVEKYIVEALRDQIEDCAKKADEQENELTTTAEKVKQQDGFKSVNEAAATQLLFAAVTCQQVGVTIRALAAPGEERESEDEKTP